MSEFPLPDPLPEVARCFPELPHQTIAKLGHFTALVRNWNTRVNLISRKDIEHLEMRHLVHSLLATKWWRPTRGAMVADLGTGGGFPGLPLAIVHPECLFTLVDSVGKKARAVREIAAALGLGNVRVESCRAESLRGKYDFVFGRAVTALPKFLEWARPLLLPGVQGETPNGLLYFKGTLWKEELKGTNAQPSSVWDLHAQVGDPYFEGKFLLHFKAPIPSGRA